MKKLSLLSCLSTLTTAVLAQGTVNFANTPATLVSTNEVTFGGTAGPTAPLGPGRVFYFALFTAPSTVTSLSPDAQELLGPTWTFADAYATNSGASSGGRFSGGASGSVATGWAPGQTNSFVIVGWSGNLGHDWSQIAPQFNGARFVNGTWQGFWGNLGPDFFGISSVGFGAAGGGTDLASPFPLFGSGPTFQGNPLTSGFTLFVVDSATPEPGSFALSGLGAGLLVIAQAIRRRRGHRARFVSEAVSPIKPLR